MGGLADRSSPCCRLTHIPDGSSDADADVDRLSPANVCDVGRRSRCVACRFGVPADDYPSRPIHLIITSPAGSLVDVIGRLYAEPWSERLGQPVVVDNRSGGMTQLGTDVLVHADPDGYTLMIGPSELADAAVPEEGLSVRSDQRHHAGGAGHLVVDGVRHLSGLPVQTLPEFIAYAKADPESCATARGGVGGALHIAVEVLKLKTGIDIVHVPYRGGDRPRPTPWPGRSRWCRWALRAPASPRAASFDPGADRADPASAVSRRADHRRIRLAEVRMDTWFGLVAPPNTPAAIVERLDRATAEVEQQQGFRDDLAKIGCAPPICRTPNLPPSSPTISKKWRQC